MAEHSVAPAELLMKAFAFASEKHRHDKHMYTSTRISKILFDLHGNISTDVGRLCVLGAILKNTVSKTNTTLAEIEQEFGKDVRDVVKDVSVEPDTNRVDELKDRLMTIEMISRPAQLIFAVGAIEYLWEIQDRVPTGWSLDMVRGYHLYSRELFKQILLPQVIHLELERLFKYRFQGEEMISEDEDVNKTRLTTFYELLAGTDVVWIVSVKHALNEEDMNTKAFVNVDKLNEHLDTFHSTRTVLAVYPGNTGFRRNTDYWMCGDQIICVRKYQAE